MNLLDIRLYFRLQLKDVFSTPEADDVLKRLILFYFRWEPIKIGLEPNYQLSDEEEGKLLFALEELKKHKPLQYIIGTVSFMDLEFNVSPSVLIPRPETEDLVRWILEDEKTIKTKHILDIGTGSGCIAISLKKIKPYLQVSALDNSRGALEVAKQNALDNKVKIQFKQQDILNNHSWDKALDMIVSNPPYIPPSEKKLMKKNVLDYEPKEALYVPENEPLLFYKKIISFAQKNLTPKGMLYFEINPFFKEELCTLLKNHTFESIVVKNDFLNKPRMIKAVKI